MSPRRAGLIALSFVPPAVIGYTLEREIEERLGTPPTVAAGLICGSLAMAWADRAPQTRSSRQAGWRDALWLGVAQACALIPGVSRNGATLATARRRRFTRADANRLSRHVALPVIAGATLLKGARLARRGLPPGTAIPFALGAGASFASTLGSTWLIRQVERDRSLLPYAAYRLGLAGVVITRLCARRPRSVSCTTMAGVTDAYAAAGVDTHEADHGVAALVDVLKRIEPGRPSLSVPLPGHYASVLRIAPGLGIALATDSVGSKVIVAAQARRFDTIGIDCVAMNVNDLICVGAEPLALLDYVAVESADPALLREIGEGLRAGADAAGIEIPGGEVCQLPEVIRGHPSPYGFDLVGSAFGTVGLDAIIDGGACRSGDALIGVPASGVHSNGLSLARRALLTQGGLSLDHTPSGLGGASVADVLLQPTVIYVRAALALLHSPIDVHGLAHITGGGVCNLLRLGSGIGFQITAPLPVLPVFSLIAELGAVTDAEMWEVFNMGCGLCAIVSAESSQAAVQVLSAHHPGTAVIGQVTDREGVVELPGLGIEGGSDGLRAA